MAFTEMRVLPDHRAFDLPMAAEHEGNGYSSSFLACCRRPWQSLTQPWKFSNDLQGFLNVVPLLYDIGYRQQ